jgi:hypothetical protein
MVLLYLLPLGTVEESIEFGPGRFLMEQGLGQYHAYASAVTGFDVCLDLVADEDDFVRREFFLRKELLQGTGEGLFHEEARLDA